ncbi:hypothetical protein EI94DRAFT_383628 [Lactarius quietus]|nr:hypothetical protein EI94DRAFT_383628 [Lactarius quietus]
MCRAWVVWCAGGVHCLTSLSNLLLPLPPSCGCYSSLSWGMRVPSLQGVQTVWVAVVSCPVIIPSVDRSAFNSRYYVALRCDLESTCCFRMQGFLQRFRAYSGIPLTPAMTEVLGKIMTKALCIFALVTKERSRDDLVSRLI